MQLRPLSTISYKCERQPTLKSQSSSKCDTYDNTKVSYAIPLLMSQMKQVSILKSSLQPHQEPMHLPLAVWSTNPVQNKPNKQKTNCVMMLMS